MAPAGAPEKALSAPRAELDGVISALRNAVWVNAVGLKRRGFSDDQIRNVRRAYRVLYRSGLKLKAALEELDQAAVTQEEIRPFVDFIRRSSRSIVR